MAGATKNERVEVIVSNIRFSERLRLPYELAGGPRWLGLGFFKKPRLCFGCDLATRLLQFLVCHKLLIGL